MALANQEGQLLLSTGNKSELAVGYCTLYGDMNGGLSVIGDLYKTSVFKLCNWIDSQSSTNCREDFSLPKKQRITSADQQKAANKLNFDFRCCMCSVCLMFVACSDVRFSIFDFPSVAFSVLFSFLFFFPFSFSVSFSLTLPLG